MKYEILENGLKITLESEDKTAWLLKYAEDPQSFDSNQTMHDLFESFISNCELTWINPSDTGDLTDAPMLGIMGEAVAKRRQYTGYVHVGRWASKRSRIVRTWYEPILFRWAWMGYETESLQGQLLKYGEAILEGGGFVLQPK